MAGGQKPGTKTPTSGIWRSSTGTRVALSRGDRFPPTKAGGTWKPENLIQKKPK